MAGFGYGDESLENDISQVKVDMTIEVDINRALNQDAMFNFDLLVFERKADYLCYVEAVYLMIHMGVVKKCSFINDPDIFKPNMRSFEYDRTKWLSFESRTNELFVVIDNTEFRQAQTERSWRGPVIPRNPDGSEDVFIQVWFRTQYTSNSKYSSWMSMFVLLGIVLGSLFIFAAAAYSYQRCVYFRYAKERKQIKRELLKIKDTEYYNFLLQESEQYKNMKVWNQKNAINQSLNQTQEELDLDADGTDESD